MFEINNIFLKDTLLHKVKFFLNEINLNTNTNDNNDIIADNVKVAWF